VRSQAVTAGTAARVQRGWRQRCRRRRLRLLPLPCACVVSKWTWHGGLTSCMRVVHARPPPPLFPQVPSLPRAHPVVHSRSLSCPQSGLIDPAQSCSITSIRTQSFVRVRSCSIVPVRALRCTCSMLVRICSWSFVVVHARSRSGTPSQCTS
jgi:hypothetical protein